MKQWFRKDNSENNSVPEVSPSAAGPGTGPESGSGLSAKSSGKKSAGAGTAAAKGGFYSLGITLIVLAILVMVNVLFSVLPNSLTNFDISAARLYSITSNTRVVVNALDKDVTIYWIVQADAEDKVIENLLDKYEGLSDHITVVKRNPDIYPTFAAQYTDENVLNNSLVVECGDRYRYIGYDDIYLTETNYATYSSEYYFDGEGAVTSAIDYVVSEELPVIYLLEGHGESEIPATFQDQIDKANMELKTFSLLNEDEIPEDADCILIYAPATDISEEEKDILAEYVSGGGKLMAAAGPTEDGTLENLYSLLSDYGVYAVNGIVVEGDRMHYAFQAPYILLPDIEHDEITNPLIESNYYVIMPVSQGLDTSYASGSVTTLLSTSGESFSKTAGYALTTYEKEEEDIDGPFALAVSADCGNGGKIIWFGSSEFLEDIYNSYSSGANVDLALNALKDLIGESDAAAIRSKSLDYNYLTISASDAGLLKLVMIGILPLAFVIAGVFVIVRRRVRYK